MALKFEKNTEAFLAVLAAVLGADNVGSLEERDVLYKKVKAIPLFGNPSMPEFSKLLADVDLRLVSVTPLPSGAHVLRAAASGSGN